jgi:hypothetical protein
MGRHAAAVDADDEALASEPSRAGAHRAEVDPIAAPKSSAERTPAAAKASGSAAATSPAAAKRPAKPAASKPQKKGSTP